MQPQTLQMVCMFDIASAAGEVYCTAGVNSVLLGIRPSAVPRCRGYTKKYGILQASFPQKVPAASDSDGVGQEIAGNSSGFMSSLLSRQKRSDPAENPNGPLQVHQLIVQCPPLCCLL